MTNPAPSVPGQVIALVVFSGIGVLLFFYPELLKRFTTKILDFEGVPPESWRRKHMDQESYPLQLRLYGFLCFAIAAFIVLVIIQNDF